MHAPASRSLALDVMRGLTVALMIVVNMSLSEQLSYGALLHARWHGLTPTDLVFPSFLFVVGASMAFTLERAAVAGRGRVMRQTLRRSALLFLCGFLLSWFPFVLPGPDGHWALRPLAEARWLGVLQRIALCQLIATAVLLRSGGRGAALYSALALLGNWAVMLAFGDFTLEGSAALKLDLWAMGAAHLYRGEGLPYDPEGLLGTWPAVVNVLAGHAAMRWLRRQGPTPAVLWRLAGAGAACVLLALAWDSVLPINKKLWTSSYVLCTVGIDALVLAGLSGLIDRQGWRRGVWVAEVFGRNPLFIYLVSELLMALFWLLPVGGVSLMEWLYQAVFQGPFGDKPGSLLYALVFTAGCWGLGWLLYRRRIVIRL